MSLSTKKVVAIGIGAALYGALSAVAIPIGPNTSLKIAIAILTIFGALFGPVVGFLVGFLGHALNDFLTYGSVWWSWVLISAFIGGFSGLITLDKKFNIAKGIISKFQIVKLYIYSALGMIVGGVGAYIGDVYFYGEPARKTAVQLALATPANYIVAGVVGIPIVILMAKKNKKHSNLELD